jgi:hypothetical protein
MSTTWGVLSQFRQPEYTGENRCLPCTVVNAIIAVGLAAVVGAVGWTQVGAAVGGGTALAVLGVSAAAIYVRGYLVPGTPSLTKQYLPERVLGWFGKAPEPAPEPTQDDLNPEAILVGVGALEECADGEDLCVTDDFRTAWYDAIDGVEDDAASRERLLELLDLDDEGVEFEEFGDAFQAYVGEQPVGTWESEAAFRADLGAATVLADRSEGWDERPVHERGRLLTGLRLFIDRCPDCGAVPRFGTETVESCCSTHEVAAVECEECGARLLETRT